MAGNLDEISVSYDSIVKKWKNEPHFPVPNLWSYDEISSLHSQREWILSKIKTKGNNVGTSKLKLGLSTIDKTIKLVQNGNSQIFEAKKQTKRDLKLWKEYISKEWITWWSFEYFNDDDFLSGKWWSGWKRWNDNNLTGGVKIGISWKTKKWNEYEAKTESRVYNKRYDHWDWWERAEFHESKLGKILRDWDIKNENGITKNTYWIVAWTTYGDIGKKVQEYLHDQMWVNDVSQYSYDKDKGNWFGVYLEHERYKQIIWERENGIVGYYGIWWKVMSWYWETMIHGKLWWEWIIQTEKWPFDHVKAALTANREYYHKDVKGNTIQRSLDGRNTSWIDAEVSAWWNVGWGNLDIYATEAIWWNRFRDSGTYWWIEDQNTKERWYNLWIRWKKDL